MSQQNRITMILYIYMYMCICMYKSTCIKSFHFHYDDVIMDAMASQTTSLTVVYSSIYSGADQRKHQSSTSLTFVRGIHRWPVNSPHKGPVTQKMFPFDDVIMMPWGISHLGQHWFSQCFLTCWVTNHCLNQWWVIIYDGGSGNQFQ